MHVSSTQRILANIPYPETHVFVAFGFSRAFVAVGGTARCPDAMSMVREMHRRQDLSTVAGENALEIVRSDMGT